MEVGGAISLQLVHPRLFWPKTMAYKSRWSANENGIPGETAARMAASSWTEHE